MSENNNETKIWFLRHPLITLLIVAIVLWNIVSSIMSQNINTNNKETNIEENLSTEEQYLNKNRWVAKMMCRNAIKTQLKTPSTADFKNQNVEYTWIKWKEALVTWIVSSQNSFWALVENTYAFYFWFINWDYQIVEAKILNNN